MTDKPSLLPPNATAQELAIEQVTARIEDVPIPIKTLWNPHTCPVELLPWLAWAFGVDEWDSTWDEDIKRQVVASSLEIRKHKGTVWAVRQALISAGYADAEIQEGLPILTHDGSETYNSVENYAAGARWALFKVIADIGENKGVSNAERDRLIRLITRAKNVRSVLREIAYQATIKDDINVQDDHSINVLQNISELRPAGRRYDGAIDHDQATKLSREIQNFDGAYRHNSELHYEGLKPYYEWDISGERYSNQWDTTDTRINCQLTSKQQAIIQFNNSFSHEGAATYGNTKPCVTDVGLLSLKLRRKYNNRLMYNGVTQYAGSQAKLHAF